MISKKRILNARQSNSKVFLELILKFMDENRFSAQDSARIALGAAMSVVDRVPDPKKTRELLGVVKDWTRGRALDKDLEKVRTKLWKLYDAIPNDHPRSAAHACSTVLASIGVFSPRTNTWAISDALHAGAHPQEIIDSIEKETGPLDWFLASRNL